MPLPAALDHIVITVPDLQAGAEEFADLTGVRPFPGGAHTGAGTANELVGLQPAGFAEGALTYIELLGPDPQQPPRAQLPLDAHLSTGLEVRTWAVHPLDFDGQVAQARAAGVDLGEVAEMSRRTAEGELLEWRLTRRVPLPRGGAQPFLIDWGASKHPARSLDADIVLDELAVIGPEPEAAAAGLRALGAETTVEQGPAWSLRLRAHGPHGEFELG